MKTIYLIHEHINIMIISNNIPYFQSESILITISSIPIQTIKIQISINYHLLNFPLKQPEKRWVSEYSLAS